MDIKNISLGEKADYLKTLKDQKTNLNNQVTNLNKEIELVERAISEECEQIGTDIVRTDTVTVTVTKAELPTVEDWALFYDYIIENNAPFMLHKRVSLGPCQELWASGVEIPGVIPTVMTKVSTRGK